MNIRILTTAHDLRRYNDWILTHPQGNLWQSLERKQYLEACGKIVRIYVAEDDGGAIAASALISIDRTIGGLSTWEIARGPLWKMENEKNVVDLLLERIIEDAKKNRCIEVLYSPAQDIKAFSILNSQFSIRHVYPQATRILDLTHTEDRILAAMHPKGRYNIGVARKHGITVTEGSKQDIDAFYELLQNTGNRDGFKISQKSHYTRFLSDLEGSFMLIAKHEGKAIAGLMGVTWNGTGFYYYGTSSYKHRHLMAPYLLQWEAIRYCKSAGCTRYDLLGIAPENVSKDDPWAGISDFKRKFGGEVITYPKEQMIVLRPIAKMMLELKRSIFG
ncbi:peptidoglycan bridge formation glycyltransferase FemA/FemB family protein [Candidatus Peribacteria bacterium]|nr:peptidoglycan bridge formation glycyltransferase FemA/FemB family protein [Candidatus Peribacteria bacterium]